jgi:hypothetical protein
MGTQFQNLGLKYMLHSFERRQYSANDITSTTKTTNVHLNQMCKS